MDPRTRCARGPREEGEVGRGTAPAIVPSSTFGFDDDAAVDRYYETGQGWVYSRYDNPTVRATERFIADLERADDAVGFASGMAAITTLFLAAAESGERVAVQRELYGGAADFVATRLPRHGVEVVLLDRDEIGTLEPQRLTGCRLLYLETPINPTLRLVDLRRAAEVARAAGVPVAVDGTFAPPVLQRPIDLGVDLVVHSATKYLGGHSDLMGGVVAGGHDWVERLRLARRSLGGIMDPFTAFLLQRGMRTLALRMSAHGATALAVAVHLEQHPQVETVHYPALPSSPDRSIYERQMTGGGGMISFVARGGTAAAVRVHDRLQLFRRAGSLGGVESLVSIPAKMSHRYLPEVERRRAGVVDGMLRLSVGIEAPEDLIADLDAALEP